MHMRTDVKSIGVGLVGTGLVWTGLVGTGLVGADRDRSELIGSGLHCIDGQHLIKVLAITGQHRLIALE